MKKAKPNWHIVRRYQNRSWYLMVILFFALVGLVLYLTKPPIISPCPDTGCYVEVLEAPETIDSMVDLYAKKYGKTTYDENRIKVIIHYLLLREQNYGGSTACGDSGKACGPLQFHQSTYVAFRSIMMKRGLVTYEGSRLVMRDAIETTAWAISDGREKNWGPIVRKEIKI